MESHRARPHATAWLGIVAVLGNLLASVICVLPAKAVAPIDDVLGPLVLCTEHGPQAVPGSEPASGGEDRRDGESSHCKACTLLAGLALLSALLFAGIVFAEQVFRPFASAARTLADHLSLGGIRSRAPPLPA